VLSDEVWLWDTWPLTNLATKPVGYKGWNVILALVAPRSGGFPGAMRSPRSATSSRATPRAGIKTALSFCAEPRASGPDRRCSRADANGVWFASQRFRHSRIVAEADAEAAVWVDADLTLAPAAGTPINVVNPSVLERGSARR
jgi:hypothetical protein